MVNNNFILNKKINLNKKIAFILPLIFTLSIIILITILIFNVTDYGITIASLAATIFMILSNKSIKKRVIYGSYIVSTFVGFLFSTLSENKALDLTLAVIASIIIMTLFDLQHAPAIGLSVSIVLNKFNLLIDIIILLYIFFIFGLTTLIKLHMSDPYKLISYLKIFEVKEEKINWNLKEKPKPDYLKLGPY